MTYDPIDNAGPPAGRCDVCGALVYPDVEDSHEHRGEWFHAECWEQSEDMAHAWGDGWDART